MATEQQIDTELTAEIRARVPQWMKDAIAQLAKERLLDNPDIAREALCEYLERRGKRSRPDGQLGLPLSKAAIGKKVAA